MLNPDQSNVRNIGAALNKFKTIYATTFIGNPQETLVVQYLVEQEVLTN